MPNEKSTRRVREFRARQREEAAQNPGLPRGGYRQTAGRPRGGYRQNAGRPRGNRTALDRQRDYLQRKREKERAFAMTKLNTNDENHSEIEQHADLQAPECDSKIFKIEEHQLQLKQQQLLTQPNDILDQEQQQLQLHQQQQLTQLKNVSQTNLCRLCVTACISPKSLYSANGVGNWVYEVAAKYFQTVFSNAADTRGTQLPNICEKCWCYIADYHTFELSIFGAQVELLQPAPKNVCRLCVRSYGGDQYKPLFNNPDNEVYRITFKYMHSMFSNPEGQTGENLGAICLICWDHLQKFHKFQTRVYASQKMLSKGEDIPHEGTVKLEKGIETPMVNQSCASQTADEQISINAKHFATDPKFSVAENDVRVKSEPIDVWDYETLNQANISGHNAEVRVKSEVDSMTNQRSTEEISSGFKDAYHYQDSIVLPKLEILDVPSEGDCNN